MPKGSWRRQLCCQGNTRKWALGLDIRSVSIEPRVHGQMFIPSFNFALPPYRSGYARCLRVVRVVSSMPAIFLSPSGLFCIVYYRNFIGQMPAPRRDLRMDLQRTIAHPIHVFQSQTKLPVSAFSKTSKTWTLRCHFCPFYMIVNPAVPLFLAKMSSLRCSTWLGHTKPQ